MRNTARARISSIHRSANKRRVSRSASNRRVGRAAKGHRISAALRSKSTKEDQARRLAERTTTSVADAMRQGTAIDVGPTLAMGQGYFATAKAVRDFNIKLIEIGQVNAMATLKFAQQVSTAKRPGEAAIFWSSQAGKRFEMVTDQSVQLMTLAQKVLASGMQPLTHSFGQTLRVLWNLPPARFPSGMGVRASANQ